MAQGTYFISCANICRKPYVVVRSGLGWMDGWWKDGWMDGHLRVQDLALLATGTVCLQTPCINPEGAVVRACLTTQNFTVYRTSMNNSMNKFVGSKNLNLKVLLSLSDLWLDHTIWGETLETENKTAITQQLSSWHRVLLFQPVISGQRFLTVAAVHVHSRKFPSADTCVDFRLHQGWEAKNKLSREAYSRSIVWDIGQSVPSRALPAVC